MIILLLLLSLYLWARWAHSGRSNISNTHYETVSHTHSTHDVCGQVLPQMEPHVLAGYSTRLIVRSMHSGSGYSKVLYTIVRLYTQGSRLIVRYYCGGGLIGKL